GRALMAVASIGCAVAGDLTTLLIARGAQALGGAGGLIAVFAILGGGEGSGRRMWVGAAGLGTAIGPALGGVVTGFFRGRRCSPSGRRSRGCPRWRRSSPPHPSPPPCRAPPSRSR